MNHVITRTLSLLGGTRFHLLVGVACLMAGAVAGGQAMKALKNEQIATLERDYARSQAAAAGTALARVQGQGRITAHASGRAAENLARLEIRYRSLRQKVPVYVTTKADADVPVPLGAILLLDAAAKGDDPDGVSFAAGKSYDTASGVTLAQLVGAVVDNYGLANANAQQLGDLQGWIREQEALAP